LLATVKVARNRFSSGASLFQKNRERKKKNYRASCAVGSPFPFYTAQPISLFNLRFRAQRAVRPAPVSHAAGDSLHHSATSGIRRPADSQTPRHPPAPCLYPPPLPTWLRFSVVSFAPCCGCAGATVARCRRCGRSRPSSPPHAGPISSSSVRTISVFSVSIFSNNLPALQ
jgi:hypothetical protein